MTTIDARVIQPLEVRPDFSAEANSFKALAWSVREQHVHTAREFALDDGCNVGAAIHREADL